MQSIDIVGLGNALVDVLAHIEDDFLIQHRVQKGSMRLINKTEADSLWQSMKSPKVVSGGSAANTIVGASMLGLKTAFIGKVANDTLGELFINDLRANGIACPTLPQQGGEGTGRSLILVTPDGERTMNTYLGAAQNLKPSDVDEKTIEASQIVYLEGYLWDPEHAKAAFKKAADIAHAKGRMVALTLSDTFCVDRWRDEFLNLMQSGAVDLVFCNQSELHSLYQTSSTQSALDALKNDTKQAVITFSQEGCMVLHNKEISSFPAIQDVNVVDTTGAGDLFAAGFMAGMIKNRAASESAQMGAILAAEIISHTGARAERNLQAYIAEAGLQLS